MPVAIRTITWGSLREQMRGLPDDAELIFSAPRSDEELVCVSPPKLRGDRLVQIRLDSPARPGR